MNLETRAYLCSWMTQEKVRGFQERVPSLLAHIPEPEGHSWSAVEIPTQDQCIVLLTFDKDITGATEAANAFAAAGAAPQAEALEVGEMSLSFSNRPTRPSVLARCEAHRIPSAVVGAMPTVRDATREIVRRALIFQILGYPPAELSEPIGMNLTSLLTRARQRGMPIPTSVRSTTTVGATYAAVATSPYAHFGLESGEARFGHPLVHLGL